MRPPLRKLAAASAAAYLLAGWLAAAFHSHVHAGHASESAEAEVCEGCSCGHRHGPSRGPSDGHRHGPAEAEHEHGSPACPGCPEDGHHHCLVCDHLAKPPLAVEAVEVVTAVEPAAPAAEPVAPAFTPVARLVERSRGPPVA